MTIGLRVDVDTLRGHLSGVPALYRLFQRRGIGATFYFSVGPDNMGRHLYRLLKPRFLLKMLRSSAPSLYGWDILIRGTIWPGPSIGKAGPDIIRQCAPAGHELGLHAWDHHAWQMKIGEWNQEAVGVEVRRAYDLISEAAGQPPTTSAAPSWRVSEAALLVKEFFPFDYNSDCRGGSPFLPIVGGRTLSQPQVPNTLPTYDEMIGAPGVTDATYNGIILERIAEQNGEAVLTIHAEVEGMSRLALFEDFLDRAAAEGYTFAPLGELLPADHAALPSAALRREVIAGREGWVSVASPPVKTEAC